jgi:hypothetical protein
MNDLGRDRRGFLAGAAGTGLILFAGGASAGKPAEARKEPPQENSALIRE